MYYAYFLHTFNCCSKIFSLTCYN